MITILVMMIIGLQMNDEERMKFLEELTKSKYLSVFVGLFFIIEIIIEFILTLIKLIRRK